MQDVSTPIPASGGSRYVTDDRYVSIGVVVVYTCTGTISAVRKIQTLDVENKMAQTSQPNGLPDGIDTGLDSQDVPFSIFQGPGQKTYIHFQSNAGDDDCARSALGPETLYTVNEQLMIIAEDQGSPTAYTKFTVVSPFGQLC